MGGLEQPLWVVFRVSWSGAKRKKIASELAFRVSNFRCVPDASGPFLDPLLAVCLQNDTPSSGSLLHAHLSALTESDKRTDQNLKSVGCLHCESHGQVSASTYARWVASASRRSLTGPGNGRT